MWSLIKKAGEFIAPIIQTNSFEEFKESCNTVLATILKHDTEDTIAFNGALNNIQDYLNEEIDSDDHPCLDYFVSESIMQKIVDSINENFPTTHIQSIFDFFSVFLTTGLNKHILQVTVHRPFAQLLSKLDILYLKDQYSVRKFASSVWDAIYKSPIALEMMTVNGKYPILDFFFSFVFSPEDSNDYARDAVLMVVSETSSNYPPIFKEYIRDHLYSQVVDFIIQVSECATTIQFKDTFTSLLLWADNLLTLYGDFPVDSLFEKISNLELANQLLTISLLLSFFIAPVIFDNTIKFVQKENFSEILCKCLDSEKEFDKKSAVTCIKTVLRCDPNIIGNLIPIVQTEPADVLSLLPPEWLVQVDGSSAMEAYESDAITRINFYGTKNNKRSVGTDNKDKCVFIHILNLLSKFKEQSISLALSLSQLILMILANAPDLISDDLAKSYESAVEQYKEVPFFQMESLKYPDSPEFRAAILTEFGKEIHATFIASEKIKVNLSMFNNDQ